MQNQHYHRVLQLIPLHDAFQGGDLCCTWWCGYVRCVRGVRVFSCWTIFRVGIFHNASCSSAVNIAITFSLMASQCINHLESAAASQWLTFDVCSAFIVSTFCGVRVSAHTGIFLGSCLFGLPFAVKYVLMFWCSDDVHASMSSLSTSLSCFSVWVELHAC